MHVVGGYSTYTGTGIQYLHRDWDTVPTLFGCVLVQEGCTYNQFCAWVTSLENPLPEILLEKV